MSLVCGTTTELRCLECGYEIGIASASVCPECGAAVTDETRSVAPFRKELAAQGTSVGRRLAGKFAAAVLLVSSSMGLLQLCRARGEQSAVVDAIVVGAMCLVPGCLLFGASQLAALPAWVRQPATDRQLGWLIWNRHLLKLHTPWMTLPAAALVLWTCWRLIGQTAFGGQITWGAAGVLALPWSGLNLVVFGRWRRAYQAEWRRAGLEHRCSSSWGGFSGVLVFTLNLMAGIGGGFVILGSLAPI